MALPEQRDRVAQILRHLRFAHVRDQDIPPRKMVEERARIGAIVPGHHRAVSLVDQNDTEFGEGPSIDWGIMKGAIRAVGYVGGRGLVDGMDATFGWNRE
jgi:hypothetical protein